MGIAVLATRLVKYDAQSNYILELCKHLTAKGRHVTLYLYSDETGDSRIPKVFVGEVNEHTIKTNSYALCKTLFYGRELSGYDTIILSGPDIGLLPAAHLAKYYNRNLRLIWAYHGLTPIKYLYSFHEKLLTLVRRPLFYWSMRRCDQVICDSEFIAEELRGHRIWPDVVLLGFSPKTSGGDREKTRCQYGCGGGDDSLLLLYVGRLEYHKHVEDLLRLMDLLRGQKKNIVLVIAGDGKMRSRLEALYSDLGIPHVFFAGRVDDNELRDLYAACDVVITASRHEGFCVPVAEAFANGKPFIGTTDTSIPAVAGTGGLYYTPGDIGQLKNIVLQLADSKSVYNGLSELARHRAEVFSMDRCMESLLKVVTK